MSTKAAIAENLQVVVFSLLDEKSNKKENYGVEIDCVREIVMAEHISPMPQSMPYVVGVMNLRGKIIPVIDLKAKLNLETKLSKDKPFVLVLQVENNVVCILVDQVDQVMKIPIKDIEQVQQKFLDLKGFVKGIAKTQGEIIVVLDIQKVLQENNTSDKIDV